MAPEAVLQKAFAEELLGKTPKPGVDETNVGELAAPLFGKELTMRYAQREAAQSGSSTQGDDNHNDRNTAAADQSPAGAAYSVVSREQKLKIVGVADLDPESMRGPTRARVFLPLKLAESLHVMQPTDLREISRAPNDQPLYSSVSVRVKNPSQIKRWKTPSRRWVSTRSPSLMPPAVMQQFFTVLDVFLGIFGSLALAVASIGIVNTLVMAILERRREIGIMKAIGASDGDVKKLFFAEAGAMGILGGIVGVSWAGLSAKSSTWERIFISSDSLFPQSISGQCLGGWSRSRLCFLSS